MAIAFTPEPEPFIHYRRPEFLERRDDTFAVPRGAASVYVVVDAPDVVLARAKNLGAPVIREMKRVSKPGRRVREPAISGS